MPRATDIIGYAYCADVLCPSCGNAIAAELIAQGKRPSRSTDEWPQPMFATESTDTPCHCSSGATCLDAHTLSDGTKVGDLLPTTLTTDGRQYVLEAILESVIASVVPTTPPVAYVALELWSPLFSIPIPPGLHAVAYMAYSISSPGCMGVSISVDEAQDIIAFYEQQCHIDLPAPVPSLNPREE